MRRRILDIALSALFLAGICAPGLVLIAGGLPSAPLNEKRTLAPLPSPPRDGASLASFPHAFEAYYDDHFGLRALLIRSYNATFRRWLGAFDADVIFGDDDWLYYHLAARDYRRATSFEPGRLDAWVRALRRRQEWLAARGIRFLFVVVPDKDTIYPEHLPPALVDRPPESLLDQLLRRLREQTRVEVVDVRQPMLAAREQLGLLYHPADTHWNDLGAWVGYTAIVERLARIGFPALSPLPLSAFDRGRMDSLRDLADMLGLHDRYPGESPKLHLRTRRAHLHRTSGATSTFVPRETKVQVSEVADASLPRAVMFRDSFATAMLPMLSQHFSRIVYVWSDDVDERFVEAERPDVVIAELLERKIAGIPPEDSDAIAGRDRAFEEGATLLAVDPANARELLEPSGGIDWAEGDAPVLEVSDRSPLVELPRLDVAPGDRVTLRLRYDSPGDTHARLYWGSRDRWGFSRDDSFVRWVGAGPQELLFELPEGFDGRIAFYPGREKGRYQVHSLEVRRLRAGSPEPRLSRRGG
jgi:alginate O-acetyltransferase complex protein AlgJ